MPDLIALHHSSTSQHSPITRKFCISADGFPVAPIGDTIIALLPARDRGFVLATA
jgi:hypothetical protein